jgi:hypothetical protein
MIKLSVKKYLLQVFFNTSLVAFLSTIIPFCIYSSMSSGLLRLTCICFTCTFSTILIIYIVGISKNERIVIHNMLNTLRVKYGFIQ